MAHDEGIVVLDEHARAGRAGHAAGEKRGVALSGVNDDEAGRLGRVYCVHLETTNDDEGGECVARE